MIWIFAVVGLALVVAMALVFVGRETERLAAKPRLAVFDVNEAVLWIADRLSPDAQARLTHDDVDWVLRTDVDLLEDATHDPTEGPYPWTKVEAPTEDDLDVEARTVDEDIAVARILAVAEASGREIEDRDIAEILEVRNGYLEAIGAIGTPVVDEEPTAG